MVQQQKSLDNDLEQGTSSSTPQQQQPLGQVPVPTSVIDRHYWTPSTPQHQYHYQKQQQHQQQQQQNRCRRRNSLKRGSSTFGLSPFLPSITKSTTTGSYNTPTKPSPLSRASSSSSVAAASSSCSLMMMESYLCTSIETTRLYMQYTFWISLLFWIVCLSSVLKLIPPLAATLAYSTNSNDSTTTEGTTLRSLFVLSTPTIFGISLGLFLLQSYLCNRYDRLVQRRHHVVRDISNQSQTIVCEIFPKTVRERLYYHTNSIASSNDSLLGRQFGNKQPRRRSTGDIPFERSSQWSSSPLFSDTEADNNKNNNNSSNNGNSLMASPSRPIVDNYSCATVLFADIAGFTAWSAQRDPYQVFTFLETLFAAFDSSAQEHDIFKVETIGDAYMAVTGLPELDDQHAIHMCRFACDMLHQMQVVTEQLESVLSGTSSLQIRIGIHSGPVTAGVLRGTKARFQLFGDTVNTASRMESTGIPGKIQISSNTMALLVQELQQNTISSLPNCSISSWYEPRSELIDVKGKGQMQTYWLRPDDIQNQSNVTTTTTNFNSCTSSTASISDDESYNYGYSEAVPDIRYATIKKDLYIPTSATLSSPTDGCDEEIISYKLTPSSSNPSSYYQPQQQYQTALPSQSQQQLHYRTTPASRRNSLLTAGSCSGSASPAVLSSLLVQQSSTTIMIPTCTTTICPGGSNTTITNPASVSRRNSLATAGSVRKDFYL